MNKAENELIGLLNKWQDDHDVRPSDMTRSLLFMVAYFAPTVAKDDVQAAVDAAVKALNSKVT